MVDWKYNSFFSLIWITEKWYPGIRYCGQRYCGKGIVDNSTNKGIVVNCRNKDICGKNYSEVNSFEIMAHE